MNAFPQKDAALAVVKAPKLKRDWTGRLVRTVRPLENSWASVPAGSLARVEDHVRTGSKLKFAPCGCCGVRPRMTHVDPGAFEFVEPASPSPQDGA